MKRNHASLPCPNQGAEVEGLSLLQGSGHSHAEPSSHRTTLCKEEGSWPSNETGCVGIPDLSGHLSSFSFFLSEVELMGPCLRQIHIRWEAEVRQHGQKDLGNVNFPHIFSEVVQGITRPLHPTLEWPMLERTLCLLLFWKTH